MDKKDRIISLLNDPVQNLTHSFYDLFVEANVKFKFKSGVNAVIIRRQLRKCCDWCAQLSGVYEYGKHPDDIFRRHDNCKCQVTYSCEKGAYEDVHSKREFRSQREARIQRLIEISNEKEIAEHDFGIIMDLRSDLLKIAKPGIGDITYDKGYIVSKHKQEIKCAEWLKKIFGGNIRCLKEINEHGKKTPDFLWNEKLWEHKETSSINSIDKQLQKSLKQIKYNPGGVIIELVDSFNKSNDEVSRTITHRLERSCHGMEIFVIVKKGNEIVMVLGTQKK